MMLRGTFRSRVANLAGHEADELPAVVREQRRDHRQADGGEQAAREAVRQQRKEVRRVPVARDERQRHERHQACDLQHGEQVLHARPLFRASSVDEREAQQDSDADSLFDPQRHRHEHLQIQQKCARQRRDGAWNGHQHDGPPVEERPEGPVRLAHVDVEPSRLRQHGAELRQRQRAAQDQQP